MWIDTIFQSRSSHSKGSLHTDVFIVEAAYINCWPLFLAQLGLNDVDLLRNVCNILSELALLAIIDLGREPNLA